MNSSLDNILIALAVNDVEDGPTIEAVLRTERVGRSTSLVSGAYLMDLLRRKFAWSGILTTLGEFISAVIGIRTRPQMRWIGASRIISAGAIVTNELALWNRAIGQFKRKAMDIYQFIVPTKYPITRNSFTAGPKPTTIRARSLINVIPKEAEKNIRSPRLLLMPINISHGLPSYMTISSMGAASEGYCLPAATFTKFNLGDRQRFALIMPGEKTIRLPSFFTFIPMGMFGYMCRLATPAFAKMSCFFRGPVGSITPIVSINKAHRLPFYPRGRFISLLSNRRNTTTSALAIAYRYSRRAVEIERKLYTFIVHVASSMWIVPRDVQASPRFVMPNYSMNELGR